LSALVAHILTKRKYRAETSVIEKQTETIIEQNKDAMMQGYKKFLDDTNERIDMVLKREKEHIDKIAVLKKEIKALNARLDKLVGRVCLDMSCDRRKYAEIED
jgi:gas vesicle protein